MIIESGSATWAWLLDGLTEWQQIMVRWAVPAWEADHEWH